MRRILFSAIALAAAVAAIGAPAAADVDATAVFEQLKTLEGRWTGTPEGDGEEAEAEAAEIREAVHEFEVSAAGTVVMETMAPGTDHEMINMYHLDGDDLVLTHYCAGGNQPQMRLDRAASTADNLLFEFAGGTNLDPEVDQYIRSANLRLREDGGLDSMWKSYGGGEEAGGMSFLLTRSSESD